MLSVVKISQFIVTTKLSYQIESVLNITDEVLRFLLVKVDERKLKYEAKQAARKPHGEDTDNNEEQQ